MGAGPLGDDWLSGQDLILLEDGHCLRDHALAACGLEPKTSVGEDVFAATSLATLVQMVGAGLGVSFLPAMAVEAGLTDQAPISVRRLTAEQRQPRDRGLLARRLQPRSREPAAGGGVSGRLSGGSPSPARGEGFAKIYRTCPCGPDAS